LTRGVWVAAVTRAFDGHLAKAQGYLGRTRRTPGLRSNLQFGVMPGRPGLGNAEQPAAIGQGAIATGTREQMGVRVRDPVKLFVNVAFPLADDRDHRRRRKRALGAPRPLYPAVGFLRFDRLAAVIGRRRCPACPNLDSGQPKQSFTGRVNHQGGVHEQARVDSVARSSKPADPASVPGVVQFRCVLDRRHMHRKAASNSADAS